MLDAKVRKYLDDNREKHLAGLCQLLRFPSDSSDPAHTADCLACAEAIARELTGLGFACRLEPWHTHPVLLARRNAPGATKTVLLYGHYDVQPAAPLDLWTTPPFEPSVRDGAVFARGASDDKGQLYSHIKAVEALLAVHGELPVNVIFLVEGEEETGSPELETFIAAHAAGLKADCAVISDSDFFAPGVPAITYGLRGLVHVQLELDGPSEDLHSGHHGGAVRNPLNALCRMVAQMHDDNGRVTIPGFYDDVAPLDGAERKRWAALPMDEKAYAREVGAEPTGGEAGLSVLERRWARPTLDCNGLTGGHQGAGSKTVLPAKASAKISMRLVHNQRPEKVLEGFQQFVREHTPYGIRATVTVSAGALPVMVPPDSPAIQAASAALREGFGKDVALIRNGASVPITELFQRVLGIDPVLMGFGLPDDRLHAPNERMRLGQFYGGIVASAAMLCNLAGKGK